MNKRIRHLLPLMTSRLLTDYSQVDDAYPATEDSFTFCERGTVLDGFCLLPPFCRSACPAGGEREMW